MRREKEDSEEEEGVVVEMEEGVWVEEEEGVWVEGAGASSSLLLLYAHRAARPSARGGGAALVVAVGLQETGSREEGWGGGWGVWIDVGC